MNKYIHTTLRGTLTALMLMVGISVWAEEPEPTYVAQIGENKYATLQEAISAATEGQTVELIAESGITESVTNTNTNSFTINLNGKTWNGDGETAALTQNAASGTISIIGTSGSMGAICNTSGSLSISGGTFTGTITNTNGTITITGGTFSGTITNENGTITISGGTFSEPVPEEYCASGYIPTDDGNGHYGVKEGSYVAKIDDKKYETVAAAIGDASSTETTIELIANVTEEAITIPANKNVKLVGGEHTVSGTITSSGTLTIVSGIYINTTENALKKEDSGTISITGGTFSKKPADTMIASGYEVMVGADNKYVVDVTGTAEAKIVTTVDAESITTLYQTIELAIAAASTEAEEVTTIVVLKDIETAFEIPAEKKIALSITTHTISGAINNAGTLAIADGTFIGTITNSGTLNISGGTFEGTVTNSGTQLYITGGTFFSKPSNYTCEADHELVVNNEGHYVVVLTSETEAQIGDNKYLTIDKAIAAAGETATEITLLKDLGENRSISIPENAKITLTIANEVTLTNDITITNNGALTIASSVIISKVTIVRFEATVQIAADVTIGNTTVSLSTELSQAKNVLKTKTDGGITTYWVEKMFEAKIDEGITGDAKTAAESLIANTSIKEVTGLATNQSLTITVKSVTLEGENDAEKKLTKATFDVKLFGEDGQEVTGTVPAVTFRLPIHSTIAGTPWVNLWHDGTAIPGMNVISSSYVTVTTTSFSPFSYEIIENPIAQIGKTKYGSVADAIAKATAEETEIKLLQDVTTDIEVTSGKNVKLAIGSLTVSGTITNNGILTIADGTISGATSNTGAGTLTISGTANITGAVSASAGSLAISGGTIDNTITTTGTAGLNITGGTMDHAISVGGSGTNTISGGEFAEALTATAGTLTISGGTFNKAGDNAIQATSGTINITGGTFNNTAAGAFNPTSGSIKISGGTFHLAPVSSLCVAGFLPLINTAGKFDVKDRWDIVDDTDLSLNPHLVNGNYTVKTAEYQRHHGMVSAGNAETKYGTICLPFEIKEKPNGVKALYTATSISVDQDANTGTLTITEVSYPVTVGTPLIFELSEVASNMTVTSTAGEGIAVNTTAPGTAPVGDNLLVGTFTGSVLNSSSSPVLSGNIYYLNGDKFHQAKVSLTVPAFRAYLDTTEPTQGSQDAPSMLSIVKEGEDEATGIQQIEALETVTEVYDLNGRKQNGLQRGINIVRRADGSTFKVIVK